MFCGTSTCPTATHANIFDRKWQLGGETPVTSCASQRLLVTPRVENQAEATACLCQTVSSRKVQLFLNQSNVARSVQTLWTATWNSGYTQRHKSQIFYKGSGRVKEDPAGYYGMPGICWGNIGRPVWARTAQSLWIALFHFPFSLNPSYKGSEETSRKNISIWMRGRR